MEAIVRYASGAGSGQCRFEAHRMAMLLSGGAPQTNGEVGYSFNVRPRTVQERFSLSPADATPRDADMAIAFYESLGEVDDPSKTPKRVIFDEGRGGLTIEKGRVPKGLPVAIVCLFAGERPVNFVYKVGH